MTKIVVQTLIQTEIDQITGQSRILQQWSKVVGQPQKKKVAEAKPLTTEAPDEELL